jgi:hypothetical protein
MSTGMGESGTRWTVLGECSGLVLFELRTPPEASNAAILPRARDGVHHVVQLCQLMMVRSRISGIRERGGLIISELNGERFYTWSFTKHLSTILHLSAEHRSSASRLRAPLNVRNGETTMKLEAGSVSHPRIRPFSNFRCYSRPTFRVRTGVNSGRASKTPSCRLLSFAALKVNREELTTEFIANRINVPTFVVQ